MMWLSVCAYVSVHTIYVEVVWVCLWSRLNRLLILFIDLNIYNVSCPVYTVISFALTLFLSFPLSISFAFVPREFHSIEQCINGIYRLLLVSVCTFKSSVCLNISIKEKKKTQQQNQFVSLAPMQRFWIWNEWFCNRSRFKINEQKENRKRSNWKPIVLFDVARVFAVVVVVVVAVISCHITNVLLCIFDWTRSCTLFNRIDYRLKLLSLAPVIQSTRCRLICWFRTSITIVTVVHWFLFPELAHTKTEETRKNAQQQKKFHSTFIHLNGNAIRNSS